MKQTIKDLDNLIGKLITFHSDSAIKGPTIVSQARRKRLAAYDKAYNAASSSKEKDDIWTEQFNYQVKTSHQQFRWPNGLYCIVIGWERCGSEYVLNFLNGEMIYGTVVARTSHDDSNKEILVGSILDLFQVYPT